MKKILVMFTMMMVAVTTQHPIKNFSLINHKLDFAYFYHCHKLSNDCVDEGVGCLKQLI